MISRGPTAVVARVPVKHFLFGRVCSIAGLCAPVLVDLPHCKADAIWWFIDHHPGPT